jgi:lipoic acid synthetase
MRLCDGKRGKVPRRPPWLKKKIEFDHGRATSALLAAAGVATVCREAKCPNISECFKKNHATFLILGKHCTRSCAFCNVEKQQPQDPDPEEPRKVARAAARLDLAHVVITSVTRDDLFDGGASFFCETVAAIKKGNKKRTLELLIPDFKGDLRALASVVASAPDVLGHNMETVPRLYGLRPRADYARSLFVLKYAKKCDKNMLTKSALMLGLGEEEKEVLATMEDLRSVGCDFLALGQYLRPSLRHTEVVAYIDPEKFLFYKTAGLNMGFRHIEAAPYVRSSYNAKDYF